MHITSAVEKCIRVEEQTNLTPDEIDILLDAVEGFAPLPDAKWECSRGRGNQSEDEWQRYGQAAVTRLVEQGLIVLIWDNRDETICEIGTAEALELLQKPQYWSEAEGSKAIYFEATAIGSMVFQDSEQIKAYYGSEESALRYPHPEWHPFRRN